MKLVHRRGSKLTEINPRKLESSYGQNLDQTTEIKGDNFYKTQLQLKPIKIEDSNQNVYSNHSQNIRRQILKEAVAQNSNYISLNLKNTTINQTVTKKGLNLQLSLTNKETKEDSRNMGTKISNQTQTIFQSSQTMPRRHIRPQTSHKRNYLMNQTSISNDPYSVVESQQQLMKAMKYNKGNQNRSISTSSLSQLKDLSPSKMFVTSFQYDEEVDFNQKNTIDDITIVHLFDARMKDMDLLNKGSMKKAFEHFKLYINTHSRYGKLNLKNMQMGLNSAYFISKMLQKSRFSNVKILNLSNNNLCDDGTRILSYYLNDNLSLIALNLSSNNITCIGAKHLFEALESNQSIVDINISTEIESNTPNKIGPAGAQMLAQLLLSQKFIAFINLKGNGIGNKGFQALCQVLQNSSTVLSLNVEKNHISNIGLDKLTLMMEQNDEPFRLQELIIAKNDIGNQSIENFMQECCNTSQILNLNISDCSFDNEIARRLFNSLKNARFLSQINLSSNVISSCPEFLMKEFILSNSNLRILNLSQCQMGDPAAIGLFKGLQKNNILFNLKLRQNLLTDAVSDHLYNLLQCKVSLLKSLDLSQNQLTDITGVKIANSLETNMIMISINLQGNSLRTASGEAFSKTTILNNTIQKIKLRFNLIKYIHMKSINANLDNNIANNLTKDIPYKKEEIKRMKFEQKKKTEITSQIEQIKSDKDVEQSEIMAMEKEFLEIQLEEEQRTKRLEEELQKLLKKRRVLDFEFGLLDDKEQKIQWKKEQEVQILKSGINGIVGMLPVYARDIKEGQEKNKKLRKEFREQIMDLKREKNIEKDKEENQFSIYKMTRRDHDNQVREIEVEQRSKELQQQMMEEEKLRLASLPQTKSKKHKKNKKKDKKDKDSEKM
ncbi:leucine rich repeat family protein [Stylonychia lemnae]|uniref:Leucine rich repeat family protein n=1 Tax=Stylonychia lemnae TaxID=5949 RepID=A0A078A031_STYLE|nr:leucine rich repeat family protein [Stylonychia lemnae]|eukprot:CDW75237.1 leucine rich repeat family protein [Stylonychia lemnae]